MPQAESTLTKFGPRHTIAAIQDPSVLKSLLIGDPLPRGTFCAFLGLASISLFYAKAWRRLGKTGEVPGEPPLSEYPHNQSWPELRYLQIGAALSMAVFVMAGAADPGKEWLDRLAGALIGFCGDMAIAILGVGFVCLRNLWKELLVRLRKASFGSLLVSIPLAILWLVTGLGAFVGLGMVAEKISEYVGVLLRPLTWALIALIFLGLWRGRTRAALMLRLILLFSFSAIMLSATVFMCWWVASQTAPLLVFFLAVIAALNVVFCSCFARDAALMRNLIDTRF
jgi:hypothetical protein